MSKFAKIKGTKEIYEIYKEEGNKIFLRKDNITINTTIDNIEIIDENRVNPKSKKKNYSITINKLTDKNEIMLRHLTEYEAIDKLEIFLDKMIANKIPRVRIIHGKSGGVLRNAVHSYLKEHPYIKDYRLGFYHEGGIGVTIANIKLRND